jgi:hypothetical protein
MTVTVSPETFRFVHFDAATISHSVDRLARAIGLDRDVHIEIDETTPLARIHAELGDVVTLRAESGAFEDTRRPQHYSETASAVSIGRVLVRAHDRLSGLFDDAPADEALSLAQASAWTASCMGRLARLGVAVNEQRYRYDFRNRHGFSDAADAAFDRLWQASGLTWSDIDTISNHLTSSGTP